MNAGILGLAGVALAAIAMLVASVSAQTMPTFFIGDVNCDGNVNSIDAALVLQREAGLIDSLPCSENADMNRDGITDSLDAGLILNYNAGLIDSVVRLSLNVKRPQGLCDDPEKPTKCNIPTASEFGLSVSLNNPPLEGYIAFQSQLFYGGLRYNPTTFVDQEIVWPDSAFSVRAGPGGEPPTGTEGIVAHASMTAGFRPYPVSAHRGNVVQISISCSLQPQSFMLAFLPYADTTNTLGSGLRLPGSGGGFGPIVPAQTVGQQDLDLDLSGTIEPDEERLDAAATLEINCVAPPTPVP